MADARSSSGIPLKPVYTADDIEGFDPEQQLGGPGEYPYTRGVRPPAKGGEGWIQRELSGEGDPRRSNEQFKYLLSKGQTGLDIIGDTPTVAMMDPDHPFAHQTVGTQGVSLCCLEDVRELYRDLPIDRITLSHSAPACFIVPALHSVARERGISPSVLRGSVIQTPYYGEDNGYAVHLPSELRLRLAADTIEFCSHEMPRYHSFLEDTYYISDGVLDAVEEMALGFVEIRGVVRELLGRGVDIDSFAPRIAILVNCRMDFFEEIAKIRATRRLFARMLREEFGARDPRSLAVNIAAHTSGMSLTAQQPVNNVVRGAIQALSLALADVQGIEVSAFDEGLRTPSPEAHEVGLRTQQIVHLESKVAEVADPLGGSYLVESLTDELERRIWAMVQDIEAKGDPAELADEGFFRRLFHDGMEREARAVVDGSVPKVGVNRFVIPEEEDTLLREVAEQKIEPYRDRIETIRALKQQRDAGRMRETLEALRGTAEDRQAKLIPAIQSALEADATMGEITAVLRLAYGRPADPFEMVEAPIQ
jgi:methylmalonyl-CoA mutase N-terminal domain/subunit